MRKIVFIYSLLIILLSNSLYAGKTQDIKNLFKAIKRSDSKRVEQYLKKGTSPNSTDKNGQTALMTAVQYKSEKIVQILIDKGAIVNTVDKKMQNALMYLIMKQPENSNDKTSLNIVWILIKEELEIDAQTHINRTALMAASERGLVSIVDLLLKKGANIDLFDDNGDTALDLARKKKNKKIIALLERAKEEPIPKPKPTTPDVNYTIDDVLDFLDAARTGNHIKLNRYLGKKIDPNVAIDKDYRRIPKGYTALMLGSEKGHYRIVKILIDKGALVNIRNKYGYSTALTYAKKNKHSKIVALLKNAGANELSEEELDELNRPSSFTFAMGVGVSMGHPFEIEDEVLKKLATFSTLRVGAFMDFLYTPYRFFGTGVEVGIYWMGVPLTIGGYGIRVDFFDFPLRILLRTGIGPFCLQTFYGMIISKVQVTGILGDEAEDFRLLAVTNPFNAEAGARLILGGKVNFFAEGSYVYGIPFSYLRGGLGISFKFSGP